MTERGVVYAATGGRFVEEAISSARSSLRFNRLPHLIFCDSQPSGHDDNEFLRFAPLQTSGDGYLDKIWYIGLSPFQHTLFLDTDTYITGNIEELFDLLTRFDIAATHAPGYLKHDDFGQSEAFFDCNTGVIAIRQNEATAGFIAEWGEIHERWSKAPPFAMNALDQAAFRRALWASPLSLYILGPEYNYRSVFPGRLVGQAKIIHGRSTNYEKLAAYLNAKIEPRVFKRFPPEWRW